MTNQIEKIVGGEWVEGRFVSRDLTPAEIAINALIDANRVLLSAVEVIKERLDWLEYAVYCQCEQSDSERGVCLSCKKPRTP